MLPRLRLPPALLMEAGGAVLAASLSLRLADFGFLARGLRSGKGGENIASEGDIVAIRRAIEAWARRLPWRVMCFEKGLAAHWMLRRRGYVSTLHYGAATIGGELKAHVWVTSGDLPVFGCENSDEYALLARFP